MSRWVRAAAVAECPVGKAIEVVVNSRVVALFHVPEGIYALDGVCPHQGGPLGQGALTGCLVTCPWHGWQFDVRTGKHRVNPSVVQPGFPVKIEDDAIWVDVE